MSKQLQKIKSQSAGAHFTAIINKVKYVVKPTAEERISIKTEIEAFNTKPSDSRLKKIIKLLTPQAEKKKKELASVKKDLKKQVKDSAEEKTTSLDNVVNSLAVAAEKKDEAAAAVAVQAVKQQEAPVITGRRSSGEFYH